MRNNTSKKNASKTKFFIGASFFAVVTAFTVGVVKELQNIRRMTTDIDDLPEKPAEEKAEEAPVEEPTEEAE